LVLAQSGAMPIHAWYPSPHFASSELRRNRGSHASPSRTGLGGNGLQAATGPRGRTRILNSGLISTVSRVFLSATLPHPRRASSPSKCPVCRMLRYVLQSNSAPVSRRPQAGANPGADPGAGADAGVRSWGAGVPELAPSCIELRPSLFGLLKGGEVGGKPVEHFDFVRLCGVTDS